MKAHTTIATRLLLCVLFALCASVVNLPPAAAEEAEWALLEEHWYAMEIAEARAGWVVEKLWSDGARYRSDSETRLAFRREQIPIEISMRSSFLETHAGEPVSMSTVRDLGVTDVSEEWRFEDGRIIHVSRQGPDERREETAFDREGWLTPMAARRHMLDRLAAGDGEISFATVQPDAGLNAITVTMVRTGEEEVALAGRPVPVTVWTTTTSILEGVPATQKVTAEGVLLHEEVRAPAFGRMVRRLVTKGEAMEEAPPPELLVRSFVRPSRAIDRVLQTRRVALRLRVNEGKLAEIPSAGAQVVEAGADGVSAGVAVDVERTQPAPRAEQEDAEYLASSAMIAADHELVRALAAKAVRAAGNGAGAMERAEAMRAFVHRYVSRKGLDTAFATAAETAQLRSGDCSEHAVLLCALLRAQGIPARVAVGLIYADEFLGHEGIFAWHMWTQGLIDGAWVDLDATLPRRYHAAHVLTAVSSLADGLGPDLFGSVMLLGNLEIEVLEVAHE